MPADQCSSGPDMDASQVPWLAIIAFLYIILNNEPDSDDQKFYKKKNNVKILKKKY